MDEGGRALMYFANVKSWSLWKALSLAILTHTHTHMNTRHPYINENTYLHIYSNIVHYGKSLNPFGTFHITNSYAAIKKNKWKLQQVIWKDIC